ncbi:low-affinity phosphate transporter PitH [Glutamicibacter endophyticus]
MEAMTVFTAIGIFLAMGYGVLNGFRDASTAVAAAVRTRAMTPGMAVAVAAIFAFIGTFASTSLGSFLVQRLEIPLHDGVPGLALLISALLTAGGWGLYCWWRGIPASSTHALISGLVGASVATTLTSGGPAGASLLFLALGVLLPLLLTPLLAFGLSYLLVIPATWLVRHDTAKDVSVRSQIGQAISSCAVALGLGLQDGQRTGAMIAVVLITGHVIEPGPISWTIQLTAASCLALGVLFGGWRITHTLGHRLVKIDPLRGMVAQSVASLMLYVGALALHLPLSTTQSVTSAIVGAGANQRFESVRWRSVLRVLRIWLATPVVCAVVAAIIGLAVYPLTQL